MVLWVFSIPGERSQERNILSPEERLSLYRGFTNLENTFHAAGGEDVVQASSGQVQTQKETLWLFLALMDSFEGPWRSGWDPQCNLSHPKAGNLNLILNSQWLRGSENLQRGKLSCRKHNMNSRGF